MKAVRKVLLGLALTVGMTFSATGCSPKVDKTSSDSATEAAASVFERKDVAELTALANQGYAEAQYNLGLMYDIGERVTQNKQEAARLYKLAANQGIAEAQNNLGLMYGMGEGVTQDYILAHIWLNLAASSLEVRDGKRATTNRKDVAGKMTPAQIDRAQSMARVCQVSNFKNCGY